MKRASQGEIISSGSVDTPYLAPIISSPETLRAEYRLRRDAYEFTSIARTDETLYLAKGWELHTPGATRVRLRRPKSHFELLEDRIWILLYKLGYPVLSGHNFTFKCNTTDAVGGKRKIQVFAKDDETCFVVECKSREQRGTRSLQKELQETEESKKSISDSIRKHFGVGYKPKIIWVYVTSNIIWSQSDIEKANFCNIHVVTENDLQYFETFSNHLGTAGRFQFLSEFLQGQRIPNLENVRVPAIKGRFGSRVFYSFAISPRHLLKISFVNHQAISHPDSGPAYQRMINKGRIKKIRDFISNGGFFPTNILVNFTDKCRFDYLQKENTIDDGIKFGWLYLPNKYKSAWIIDGQHRLYGFTNIDDKFLDETLFVLAFEVLDKKTEAELFITINHEQKSVPKSLLVSLQADLKLGSDDPKEALSALGSALIKSLSLDASSPFFRRVIVPDIPPDDAQNLTIAEIVKGVIRSGLFGRVVNRGHVVPGVLSDSTDRKALSRGRRILNCYFRAIMDANPERWQSGRASHISVNPGVRAHLLLISEIVKYIEDKDKIDLRLENEENVSKRIIKFINPILLYLNNSNDAQIESKFSKKFGEGGVVAYYYNLCELLLSEHPDFGSKEFHDYRSSQSDARNDQIRRDVLDIQKLILDVGLKMLKKLHGVNEGVSGDRAFWEDGIENMDIKIEATRKQQMSPRDKRAPKEAYLDIVDYMKIARQQNNWPEFSKVFNIKMPSENKGKTYYLDWIERINQLRRTAAHQSALRVFQEADFDFVNWLKGELYSKVSIAGYSVDE